MKLADGDGLTDIIQLHCNRIRKIFTTQLHTSTVQYMIQALCTDRPNHEACSTTIMHCV